MAPSTTVTTAASALDDLLSQSASGMDASTPPTCCCGRPKCAYLEHNDIALKGLEKDLQSAAQIGQALLARHEAYMVEAEEERRKMGTSIDKLESDKEELEASNARTIEENRYLLDQLEELNNTISGADGQIMSLNETLQSTMKELDRLTVLAAQTSRLETQLANLEAEQHLLEKELGSREEGEKSAIQRWKNAERTIGALQDQVERIEREAREERARHAEVVARFERRRAVEKELESAAGRLKGAAAAKGLGQEDSNNNVVSNFVKDILQDNANLQMGVMELRDMLLGSNEEVEALREQMLLHQPVLPDTDETADASKPASLDCELAKTPTAETVPDFHVHHHYHAAPKNEVAQKPPLLRRPKKRRNITSPGLRTSSSGSQTPRTSSPAMRLTPVSSAATILAQTSVTIPPASLLSHRSHTQNWSMSQAASSAAPSSIPSSPVFDTMSDGPDFSRPTTPGSAYQGSPQLLPRSPKRNSEFSEQSLPLGQTAPPSISSVLHDYDEPHFPLLDHATIPEESEEGSVLSQSPDKNATQEYDPTRLILPTLHRASSHESLLSARGLDIPKIRSKPSQRLLSGSRPSLGPSPISTAAIASSTVATAHRSRPPRGYNSSSSYNRLLSASVGAHSTSPPGASSDKPTLGNTLGKRVGGWIAGRWGMTPAHEATSPTSPVHSRSSDSKDRPTKDSSPVLNTKQSNPALQPTQPASPATSSQQKPLINNTNTEGTESMRRTQKLLGNEGESSLSAQRRRFDESAAVRRADKRLSTHVEPMHLDGELLTASLSEVGLPPAAAVRDVAGGNEVVGKSEDEKMLAVRPRERKKGRKEEKRLSTHVEALSVDGIALAESLGGV